MGIQKREISQSPKGTAKDMNTKEMKTKKNL
jgi:hypothetical protein